MNCNEILSVVTDIGNLYTRVGFTGDDFPRWDTFTKFTEKFQFGDKALGVGNTQILDVLYTFNSELYEQLLIKIFYQIYVQSKDQSLLLANNFQSKIEILFEILILDIGAYSTTASAIHDGCEQLNEPFKQYLVCGQYQYIKTCLTRDIKQSLLTYEIFDHNPQYELPDVKFNTIQQSQLTDIADKLFSTNENFKGIQHMLMHIINNCTNDIKQLLSSTVISTGGSSNTPRFQNELQTILSALALPMCKVKLVMYPLNIFIYYNYLSKIDIILYIMEDQSQLLLVHFNHYGFLKINIMNQKMSYIVLLYIIYNYYNQLKRKYIQLNSQSYQKGEIKEDVVHGLQKKSEKTQNSINKQIITISDQFTNNEYEKRVLELIDQCNLSLINMEKKLTKKILRIVDRQD